MKCELVYWVDIRKACKYPITDNNNGYIYGINIINGNEIIDVEWFKTDKERFKEIKKYSLVIIND